MEGTARVGRRIRELFIHTFRTSIKILETLRHPQRTWSRPEPAPCLLLQNCLSLAQLIPRALFSWYPQLPLALTFFPPPLPWASQSSEEMDLMDRFFLELCVPRSLSLHNVWPWVFASVPICCRKQLLWRWLNKTLNYEHSRISLRVIFILPPSSLPPSLPPPSLTHFIPLFLPSYSFF